MAKAVSRAAAGFRVHHRLHAARSVHHSMTQTHPLSVAASQLNRSRALKYGLTPYLNLILTLCLTSTPNPDSAVRA